MSDIHTREFLKKKQVVGELTLAGLKAMKPGTIFATGEFIDGAGGVNIANTEVIVPWVAVRGDIHDWAIYAQNPHYVTEQGAWANPRIAKMGDKIFTKTNIQKLVECDKEAYKQYRN